VRSGELGLNRSAVLGRYLFSAAAGQVDEFGEVPGVITLMEQREWEPVTGVRLIGFGISFGLFLLLIFRSEPGFVFLLDHANLLFHEAGHPAVGLFSSRLETYGGTLGQLVFPVVLAVSFWRKGQVLGFAAACIWFFENWFNIARYMADARALELPLVGGGDHDWNTIFTRWDVLQYDSRIAAAVRLIGWLGIAATCAWVIWRSWQDRRRSAVEADVVGAV
jgi:hypothetical protein